MNGPEKFYLSELLAEIEADKSAEYPDQHQQNNIPQSVITDLMFSRKTAVPKDD